MQIKNIIMTIFVVTHATCVRYTFFLIIIVIIKIKYKKKTCHKQVNLSSTLNVTFDRKYINLHEHNDTQKC